MESASSYISVFPDLIFNISRYQKNQYEDAASKMYR